MFLLGQLQNNAITALRQLLGLRASFNKVELLFLVQMLDINMFPILSTRSNSG